MKKFSLIVVLLFFVIVLSGCTKKSTVIPKLDEIQQNGESWAEEQLKGIKRNQLRESWGEPDNTLSGLYGEVWNIKDDYDYVVIYYDEEVKISAVKYVSVFKAQILAVNEANILVKPCDNEQELATADQIVIKSDIASTELVTSRFNVGTIILIGYDGMIKETYPAQVDAKYGINLFEGE